MTLLDRIKELCKKRDITVYQLEEKLHFGRNTIYQWNKRVPGVDKVKSVADYFNVSTDYLLGRTDWEQFDKNLGKEKLDSLVEESRKWDRSELVAAHIDDDVTEEELEDILKYINYIKSQHEKENN